MKDKDQSRSTNIPATTEPKMRPSEVFEFQRPKRNPRFPNPNQLPTQDTIAGYPVLWANPFASSQSTK